MKLNKIFSSLAGVLLLAGAASCTDEVKFTETPAPAGDQVYFSTEIATTLDIVKDATEISVPVERYKAGDELTVPVKCSAVDAEGNILEFFTFPQSVTFAKDANTSELRIGLDFSKVVAEEDYYLTITLEGDQTSPYGITTGEFTAVYAPWTDLERLGGNSDFAVCTVSGFGLVNEEVPVYVSRALEGTKRTRYQFGDADCPELQPVEGNQMGVVNGINATIVCNDETNVCSFELLGVPNGDTGTYVEFMDTYSYLTKVNPGAANNDDKIIESYKNASVFDPETGIFHLSVVAYGSALGDGQLMQLEDTYSLPGYASYFINFNQVYNIVDPTGVESVVIQAIKSDDIASYAYQVIPGALAESDIANAVAEIEADTEAEQIRDTEYLITYTPDDEEGGDYTIVAVGYDEKSVKVFDTAYTFTFTTVKAESKWKKLGEAVYTDGFFYGVFNEDIGGETWNVKVEQHKERPGLYRIVNPYKSGDGGDGWPIADPSIDIPGNHYITINAENPDGVYIEESELGIRLNVQDGPVKVNSEANLYLQQGYEIEEIIEAGFCGTFQDGVIMFPGVTLCIGFTNDVDAGGNIKWYKTNYSPEIPVIQDDKINPAQYNTMGSFMLDLNDIGTYSAKRAPRDSHAAVSGGFTKSHTFESVAGSAPKKSMSQEYIRKQLRKNGNLILTPRKF